jgi:tetratricopeptide (TPR) repeat protein
MEIPVAALAHFATGFSHDLDGRPELALEEYRQAALENPTYEPIVIEVARRYIRGKKLEQAVEVLSKVVSEKSASGTLYAWLGLAYGQLGKTEQAIAANRTAIKKMPDSLPAYQNLAQLYLQNSKTNEAVKVLDEAGRQPSPNADFLVDLADLYARFGRNRVLNSDQAKVRAKELLDRAARLNATDPMVLQKLADGYLPIDAPAKAEEIYLELLKNYPDLPVVRGKLADLYLRTGQSEKATEQWEVIAKENPINPGPQIVLGELAQREEKFAEAARYYERALLLNPNLERVYFALAGVKVTLKKPEDALALVEKARARFKRGFEIEFYTGRVHVRLEHFSEAIKYFLSAEDQARADEPEKLDHEFYFELGAAYERNKQPEDAEKHFQKSLQLSPDFAQSMNYLGYMWTEMGIKLDQARVLIEKAVKLEPKNAAFLDSLGWVLFKLNQPREALPWLIKAVENSEKPDPTLFDHLGDIHSALREHDRAREAWRKSLGVEPNDQIQRKLEAAPASGPSTP